MCARRRSFFLCLAKERNQRKATPTSATPALRAGANLRRASVGVGRRNSLCCCAAPLRQLRPISSRSACMLRCTRHPARTTPQAQPQGVLNSHTGHRVARPWARGAKRSAIGAERSDGPDRLPPLWTCREAQRAGCAWTPKDVHASCSDSLQLLERRCAAAKRVLQRTPLASIAGCPIATRWGHGQWGALLWVLSCRAARKCLARRGESRPLTSIHHRSKNEHAGTECSATNYKFNSCPRNPPMASAPNHQKQPLTPASSPSSNTAHATPTPPSTHAACAAHSHGRGHAPGSRSARRGSPGGHSFG